MTSQQLIVFLAVAENLSYRKAAEQLYISQPAITKHVSLLEKELGFQLLRRTKRDVALTPEGELFFRFAQRTRQEYDSVLLRMRQMSGGNQLGIACETSLSCGPLMASASEFMRLYPSVSIRFEYVDMADMRNVIKDHAYDVYITHSPSLADGFPSMETMIVEEKIFGILARKGYMNVTDTPEGPQAFDGCDFIDPLCSPRTPDHPGAELFLPMEERLHMIQSIGLHPANIISMPNWQSVLGAISLGMGVTLAAEGFALDWPEQYIWLPTSRIMPLRAIWYRANDNPARVSFCKILHENATVPA